jgi:hypothetical protein
MLKQPSAQRPARLVDKNSLFDEGKLENHSLLVNPNLPAGCQKDMITLITDLIYGDKNSLVSCLSPISHKAADSMVKGSMTMVSYDINPNS